MARQKFFGFWTLIGVIAFLLIKAKCQETEVGSEQVDSTEELNKSSGAAVVQQTSSSKRRPGGTIKYKKMSVKSKLKEGEPISSTVETPETRQNKTRRLKPKSSPRYTMIYKPSKKRPSHPSAEKSEPTSTPFPPAEVNEEPPSSSRSYSTTTKLPPPEEPATQSVNTFVRPTKRIRIRPYEKPTTTTTTPKQSRITADPYRPINRYRSTTATTTTQAPTTTTKFIRLSRRPNSWRNSAAVNKPSHDSESTQLVTDRPQPSSSADPPVESDETEQLEEESLIRNVATRPDSRTPNQSKDSDQVVVRPRLHLPKKPAAFATIEEPSPEPTSNEHKQQEDHVAPAEESQHQSRQPVSRPEEESESREETDKRIEKYEAEKMKQLDRLRQNKNPTVVEQPQEQLPKARRIPSSSEYRKTPADPEPVRQQEDESLDFIRVPPSNYGQRLPTAPTAERESPPPESQPTYEIVYPNLPQPPTYIYHSEPHQLNPEVHRRPEIAPTNDPESTPELYRRPEVIYKTASRPIEYIPEKYQRPEVTTSRPLEDERAPEVIYKSTPRPTYNEEQYPRPEVIFVPPKYEYQPPSAYLSGHGSYPRVRIAYYPTTIPPPSVTYEPPHLEFMPPSPSPPPRIYVPPSEEFKPPSTTAVTVQHHRPTELRNGSPIVNYRPVEDPRVIEGIRQFEAINSYARLVSVGHPAVNELPYPPVKEGHVSGSSRPQQQTDPIVVRVAENPSASNQQRGEQEKLYWVATVGNVKETSRLPSQQSNEQYRGHYDGSASVGGYITRGQSEVQPGSYLSESSGRRVPEDTEQQQIRVHQINQQQVEYSAQPHSVQQFYQEAAPQLNQPHTASERPYSASDGRYENTIPVSEQPYQKPYGPPEGSGTRAETPLQENERPIYGVFEKPITVTVRPHGIPSAEPERIQNVYRPQESPNLYVPKDVKPPDSGRPLGSNQEQPIRPEFIDPRYRYPQEQSQVPSPFYPIGPVRAYQVTQAVYSTPPPRFFQIPAPLSNPFESKYQFPPSPPAPPPPPPPTTTPSPPPISNSFEANRFSYGESWSVDPLLLSHYPLSISTSRPFHSSTLPPLPEEPQSSERLVQYRRPAADYTENLRNNRSLTHFLQTYQQPPSPQNIVNPAVFKENVHQQTDGSPHDDGQHTEGELNGVKGVPGVDYPILGSIPTHLKFKCEMVDTPETRHPAYYADPYTRCQVFHVCQSTRAKDSFLCPNGTIFNQKVRVCDWWHNVDCEESAAFYNVNADLDNQHYQQHQLLIL